jgi:hypothetical protein
MASLAAALEKAWNVADAVLKTLPVLPPKAAYAAYEDQPDERTEDRPEDEAAAPAPAEAGAPAVDAGAPPAPPAAEGPPDWDEPPED